MNKEFIICAAVKYKNKIWYGHRHVHALKAANDEMSWLHSRKQLSTMKFEQGFITSKNKFVNRKKALKIALNAKQTKNENLIMPQTGLDTSDLY